MKTVLVVDDEIDIAELLRIALENAGYRVVTAYNGQNALDVLAEMETKPDLIITDYMMPLLNGPEMVSAIKADGQSRTPVILMSAVPDTALRDYPGLFDSVLSKPFFPDTLIATIDKVLNRK